jgi:hypothetical protein
MRILLCTKSVQYRWKIAEITDLDAALPVYTAAKQ